MTKIYHQADIITAALQAVRQELGAELLSREAEAKIERSLRIYWGGQEVYVRKGLGDTDERSLFIKLRYDGRNRKQIQEELGIGRAQFYKLLKGA